MNKSQSYRWGLVAALLVAVLNSFLAVHALGTLFDAETWLAHTLEVITASSAATEQLALSNSAARGYLLTGDSLYFKRYQTAEAAMGEHVDRVDALTKDNPSQQARIGLLRKKVIVKFDAMQAAITMRGTYDRMDVPPSILVPALSDSPDRQVSARELLIQVANEEQRLLVMREQETLRAHHQVWITFSLALAFDVVLLIMAFELLVRAARARDVMATNATQIKTLNAELVSFNTDLEERVNLRTHELSIANQELEAFSYSVSHDLRAPLRTIDGFSAALEEDFADKLNDEGRDYIQRVRTGVQRMGQLIDALLQLSRVTRSDLQRERVDVTRLATLVFDELAAADPSRTTHWLAQPGVLAQADPRLLRIALENLVGNAWKFTSRTEDGRIEFGSMPRENETVYFVRDNGAGFDMQYVDRLFTAFQRLHGDRDFKGSGIGLATVSRIIRRHHGSIWAEGEPGHGATFYFTLGG